MVEGGENSPFKILGVSSNGKQTMSRSAGYLSCLTAGSTAISTAVVSVAALTVVIIIRRDIHEEISISWSITK